VWAIAIILNLVAGVVNIVFLSTFFASTFVILHGGNDSGKGYDPIDLFLMLIPAGISGLVFWSANRWFAKKVLNRQVLYWWLASLPFWGIPTVYWILRGWLPEIFPPAIP